MSYADIEAELKSLVQWDEFPTLTQSEITTLLVSVRIADKEDFPPDNYSEWVTNTVYSVDDIVVPTDRNDHYYTVSVAGTSGATEPVWPTDVGDTIADGTVTWTESGYAFWIPTYLLTKAAARGWRLKAAKCANRTDQSVAGTMVIRRSQMFAQCMAMAKSFSRSITSTSVSGAHTINEVPIIGNLNSG